MFFEIYEISEISMISRVSEIWLVSKVKTMTWCRRLNAAPVNRVAATEADETNPRDGGSGSREGTLAAARRPCQRDTRDLRRTAARF